MRFLNVSFLTWLAVSAVLGAGVLLGIARPWAAPPPRPYPTPVNVDVQRALAVTSTVASLPGAPSSPAGARWCADTVQRTSEYAQQSGAAGRPASAAGFTGVVEAVSRYCRAADRTLPARRAAVAAASRSLLAAVGASVPPAGVGTPVAPAPGTGTPVVPHPPARDTVRLPDRGPAPDVSMPAVPPPA